MISRLKTGVTAGNQQKEGESSNPNEFASRSIWNAVLQTTLLVCVIV